MWGSKGCGMEMRRGVGVPGSITHTNVCSIPPLTPTHLPSQVVHLLPHECLELPVLFREPEEQEAATDDYGVDGELLVTFANREQQVTTVEC